MVKRIVAASAGLLLLAAAAPTSAQTGVNLGSLTCNVAGGMGFVFGSSKELSCLFNRANGTAERYTGSIKKFGVDIGFTKESQIIWLVTAPGNVGPGALAGSYAGATLGATVGVGGSANVLIGGSTKQITLQPISVEGAVGLNIAGGIGEIDLRAVK
jgi:hypothetical protein